MNLKVIHISKIDLTGFSGFKGVSILMQLWGLIPRRFRRYNAFVDTTLLCGGVVHYEGKRLSNPPL